MQEDSYINMYVYSMYCDYRWVTEVMLDHEWSVYKLKLSTHSVHQEGWQKSVYSVSLSGLISYEV